jgi:uncharacterized phiE125 gp8 family phage protein
MTPSLIRTTPPAVRALWRERVWDHLRLDWDAGSPSEEPEDADLVDLYIDAAINGIDGNTWFGRALITQEWRLILPVFANCHITIPLPPLQSVDAVTYVDNDGVAQTLATSSYDVIGIGGDAPAMIALAYGASWPSTRWQPDAIGVEFTAGYGDTPDDVPSDIQAALLLTIGHLYRNRETVVTGTIATELPQAAQAILDRRRVWL